MAFYTAQSWDPRHSILCQGKVSCGTQRADPEKQGELECLADYHRSAGFG